MNAAPLSNYRVLVAEDEYFLAADTATLLRKAGATIIGPFGELNEVEDQVRRDGFDVAVLDIRLNHDLVFPAADLLQRANIPVAFLTGYDQTSLPDRFHGVPVCQKPCADQALIDMVHALISHRR